MKELDTYLIFNYLVHGRGKRGHSYGTKALSALYKHEPHLKNENLLRISIKYDTLVLVKT